VERCPVVPLHHSCKAGVLPRSGESSRWSSSVTHLGETEPEPDGWEPLRDEPRLAAVTCRFWV
jgi:hypothetical protein